MCYPEKLTHPMFLYSLYLPDDSDFQYSLTMGRV